MYEEEGSKEKLRQLRKLQAVLEKETKTRQRHEELNSKLQDEYDVLLKKLAEAELHIDQLRLGTNVDINKRFILSHQTRQSIYLQQGLSSVGHSPGWTHVSGAVQGQGETEEAETSDQTRGVAGPARNDLQAAVLGHDDECSLPLEPTPLPIDKSSWSPHQGGDKDSLLRQQNLLESGLHFESPSDHLDGANSASQLQADEMLSDGNSESLSQLSMGYISTQASAESQHLGQIFHVHSLQEQIALLKDKLNGNKSSFEELSDDLGLILEEHEKLTRNFAESSEQMESLKQKYKDKAANEISRRRETMENELIALAEQLKDLDSLLRSKVADVSSSRQRDSLPKNPLHNVPVAPSPHHSLSSGSDANFSDNSLNSPSLPAKYLDRIYSASTSTEMGLESHSPTSDIAMDSSSSFFFNMSEHELKPPLSNDILGDPVGDDGGRRDEVGRAWERHHAHGAGTDSWTQVSGFQGLMLSRPGDDGGHDENERKGELTHKQSQARVSKIPTRSSTSFPGGKLKKSVSPSKIPARFSISLPVSSSGGEQKKSVSFRSRIPLRTRGSFSPPKLIPLKRRRSLNETGTGYAGLKGSVEGNTEVGQTRKKSSPAVLEPSIMDRKRKISNCENKDATSVMQFSTAGSGPTGNHPTKTKQTHSFGSLPEQTISRQLSSPEPYLKSSEIATLQHLVPLTSPRVKGKEALDQGPAQPHKPVHQATRSIVPPESTLKSPVKPMHSSTKNTSSREEVTPASNPDKPALADVHQKRPSSNSRLPSQSDSRVPFSSTSLLAPRQEEVAVVEDVECKRQVKEGWKSRGMEQEKVVAERKVSKPTIATELENVEQGKRVMADEEQVGTEGNKSEQRLSRVTTAMVGEQEKVVIDKEQVGTEETKLERKMTEITMATLDALKKEFEALRYQRINFSSSTTSNENMYTSDEMTAPRQMYEHAATNPKGGLHSIPVVTVSHVQANTPSAISTPPMDHTHSPIGSVHWSSVRSSNPSSATDSTSILSSPVPSLPNLMNMLPPTCDHSSASHASLVPPIWSPPGPTLSPNLGAPRTSAHMPSALLINSPPCPPTLGTPTLPTPDHDSPVCFPFSAGYHGSRYYKTTPSQTNSAMSTPWTTPAHTSGMESVPGTTPTHATGMELVFQTTPAHRSKMVSPTHTSGMESVPNFTPMHSSGMESVLWTTPTHINGGMKTAPGNTPTHVMESVSGATPFVIPVHDSGMKWAFSLSSTSSSHSNVSIRSAGHSHSSQAGHSHSSVSNIMSGDSHGSVSSGHSHGSVPNVSSGHSHGSVPNVSSGHSRGSVPNVSSGHSHGSVPSVSSGHSHGSVPSVSSRHSYGIHSHSVSGHSHGSVSNASSGQSQGISGYSHSSVSSEHSHGSIVSSASSSGSVSNRSSSHNQSHIQSRHSRGNISNVQSGHSHGSILIPMPSSSSHSQNQVSDIHSGHSHGSIPVPMSSSSRHSQSHVSDVHSGHGRIPVPMSSSSRHSQNQVSDVHSGHSHGSIPVPMSSSSRHSQSHVSDVHSGHSHGSIPVHMSSSSRHSQSHVSDVHSGHSHGRIPVPVSSLSRHSQSQVSDVHSGHNQGSIPVPTSSLSRHSQSQVSDVHSGHSQGSIPVPMSSLSHHSQSQVSDVHSRCSQGNVSGHSHGSIPVPMSSSRHSQNQISDVHSRCSQGNVSGHSHGSFPTPMSSSHGPQPHSSPSTSTTLSVPHASPSTTTTSLAALSNTPSLTLGSVRIDPFPAEATTPPESPPLSETPSPPPHGTFNTDSTLTDALPSQGLPPLSETPSPPPHGAFNTDSTITDTPSLGFPPLSKTPSPPPHSAFNTDFTAPPSLAKLGSHSVESAYNTSLSSFGFHSDPSASGVLVLRDRKENEGVGDAGVSNHSTPSSKGSLKRGHNSQHSLTSDRARQSASNHTTGLEQGSQQQQHIAVAKGQEKSWHTSTKDSGSWEAHDQLRRVSTVSITSTGSDQAHRAAHSPSHRFVISPTSRQHSSEVCSATSVSSSQTMARAQGEATIQRARSARKHQPMGADGQTSRDSHWLRDASTQVEVEVKDRTTSPDRSNNAAGGEYQRQKNHQQNRLDHAAPFGIVSSRHRYSPASTYKFRPIISSCHTTHPSSHTTSSSQNPTSHGPSSSHPRTSHTPTPHTSHTSSTHPHTSHTPAPHFRHISSSHPHSSHTPASSHLHPSHTPASSHRHTSHTSPSSRHPISHTSPSYHPHTTSLNPTSSHPHPSHTPRPHPSHTPRPHPSHTPRPHPSQTPRPHPSHTPCSHPSHHHATHTRSHSKWRPFPYGMTTVKQRTSEGDEDGDSDQYEESIDAGSCHTSTPVLYTHYIHPRPRLSPPKHTIQSHTPNHSVFPSAAPHLSPVHAHLFSPPLVPPQLAHSQRRAYIYTPSKSERDTKGDGSTGSYSYREVRSRQHHIQVSSPEEDKKQWGHHHHHRQPHPYKESEQSRGPYFGGRPHSGHRHKSRHSAAIERRDSVSSDSVTLEQEDVRRVQGSHDYRAREMDVDGGGMDPLLVVNIHKNPRGHKSEWGSRSGYGGARGSGGDDEGEEYVKSTPGNMYVVNQTSSDSEGDHIQFVNNSRINLEAMLKVARQLNRRTERMRGALQVELTKQGLS